MSEYLKCSCPHCGQSIEYPAQGTGEEVPCPTCEKPFVLMPTHPTESHGFVKNQVTPIQEESKARKSARKKLSGLTVETIRSKTTAGNTPLHLAAKNGDIASIPIHLLSEELFTEKNREGNTPLHIAAMHGYLYQVPTQFLTKRTVTIPNSTWTTGSGYTAHGPTALYAAAISGYVDQIPKEFFTPEFLQIETTGYKNTLMEYLVKNKRLDLLPENYANSELWNMKDAGGNTPLQHLEYLIQLEGQKGVGEAERESYIARVRSEPATKKQKEKLRWFGFAVAVGMTKGEASDALDDCVKSNPERDRSYYDRPPTEEQVSKIQMLNKESVRIYGEAAYDIEELTYGEAKDIIKQDEWARRKDAEEEEIRKFSNPPTQAQLSWLRRQGIELDRNANVKEWELDYIIALEKAQPRQEDLDLFKQHGIISFKGDGFGAYVFADLIRSFGGSAQNHNRAKIDYGPPCQAALRDPDYHKPTLTYDDGDHCVEFTWAKSKIKEWLRAKRKGGSSYVWVS
jgi:hypothetical protein